MPNRKIKHIVAKLVGASTEETLDVYDVDAVHTDMIYNGLDQTTAGYVLDARQGKALNKCLLQEQVSISTTAKSWTLPETSVCMVLLVSGDNSVVSGLWFFRVGTASLQMLEISKGSEITIATNGLSFTIAKTSSSRTSTIVIYRLADLI